MIRGSLTVNTTSAPVGVLLIIFISVITPRPYPEVNPESPNPPRGEFIVPNISE
jgi:hypothetical protein